MDEREGDAPEPGARTGHGKTLRGVILAILCGVLLCVAHYAWGRLRPFLRARGQALSPTEVVSEGPLAGFRLEPACAARFERPVFVTQAPTGDALYVVEQDGRIQRIAPGASAGRVVLDLRARISRRGNEEGLLGLAFHPRFATNHRLFLYYSAKDQGGATGPGLSVVSRWEMGDDGQVKTGSEKIVLQVEQPYRNHNGGMIAFGPDGMLYIGLGDGGWAGDPEDNGLNPGTLLGSILRLDVDGAADGEGYRIPPDNPLVDRPGARAEVWAWGLRNPWRFSFDRQTGELWAGDVGQNAWEEVNLVQAGKNHGWAGYEGFQVYDERSARATGAVMPIAAYGRGEGISITGGYVYRGKQHPALFGRYLYADFGSGAVWALSRQGGDPPGDPKRHPTAEGVSVTKLLVGTAISSFGEDRAGELYLTSFDGAVYRLTR